MRVEMHDENLVIVVENAQDMAILQSWQRNNENPKVIFETSGFGIIRDKPLIPHIRGE